MKILKILTGIIFLLTLLQWYGYVNLQVSEKYETDKTVVELSKISQVEKQKQLKEINERTVEIRQQKKSALISGMILIVLFVVLCIILIYIKHARTSINNVNVVNNK